MSNSVPGRALYTDSYTGLYNIFAYNRVIHTQACAQSYWRGLIFGRILHFTWCIRYSSLLASESYTMPFSRTIGMLKELSRQCSWQANKNVQNQEYGGSHNPVACLLPLLCAWHTSMNWGKISDSSVLRACMAWNKTNRPQISHIHDFVVGLMATYCIQMKSSIHDKLNYACFSKLLDWVFVILIAMRLYPIRYSLNENNHHYAWHYDDYYFSLREIMPDWCNMI